MTLCTCGHAQADHRPERHLGCLNCMCTVFQKVKESESACCVLCYTKLKAEFVHYGSHAYRERYCPKCGIRYHQDPDPDYEEPT